MLFEIANYPTNVICMMLEIKLMHFPTRCPCRPTGCTNYPCTTLPVRCWLQYH